MNGPNGLRNTIQFWKADIIRLLGRSAYDILGRYKPAWIASQVFCQSRIIESTQCCYSSRVLSDTEAWVNQQIGKPYVIKEAALMKAAGDGNSLDKVIVVQAPTALRIERIRKRDPHRSGVEILNIINRQISDDERIRYRRLRTGKRRKPVTAPPGGSAA